MAPSSIIRNGLLSLILCICLSGVTFAQENDQAQDFYSTNNESAVQSNARAEDNDELSLEDDDSFGDDILDLDIEQLGKVDVVVPSFDVEVSTVTRKESTVGKSPAAVFVITQDMIRKNGARSIPEILRMAPGLHVAQINSNRWAISSRGVSGFISNKTLVLIDGRKITSPLFDGTVFGSINWDAQDLVIEDIARIEVVRGPGGTLWGANAVNGVINIITKSAKETQGSMISAGAGNEDKAITSIRHGDKKGKNFYYRVYGKQTERDRFQNTDDTFSVHGTRFPQEGQDDWRQQRIGFRSDWDMNGNGDEILTMQGDYFQGQSGFGAVFTDVMPPHHESLLIDNTRFVGGNFLARWTKNYDDDTSSTLQAYYDTNGRQSEILNSITHIFDVELTNTCSPWTGHHFTYGARFRSYNDEIEVQNGAYLFDSPKQTRNMGSLFFQDEVEVIEDVLTFWYGTKVEHNDYTGIENQPSSRFLWTLNEREIIWGAVSRAVRTPSRTEDDLRLNIGVHDHTGATLLAQFNGSRNLQAENVVAYELGYRSQPNDWFSWDVAGFYNEFTDLIAFAGPVTVFVPPSTGLFIDTLGNNMTGESYGAEISANVKMNEWWKIMGSVSYVQIILDMDDDVDDSVVYEEGATPHAQVFMQSSFDITNNVELDISTRYLDKLPASDSLDRSYIEMGARVGYRPNENWEFALVGANLLNPSHRESDQVLINATRPERSLFGQVVWRR